MFKVEAKPLVWIPLKDGVRLAAKFWMPIQNDWDIAEKFPAIIEYIPYRRNDFTAERDEIRHPWISSHGYVVIRVDIRGNGDSDGHYYDEYTEQELNDCVEVIGWIRLQPWSSGSVGMIGKSWGGFNGLQVASMNPEGLKAIISVCSTDDRYEDHSHFKEGCVVPSQMLPWSCYMLTSNAAPPDPMFVGDKWKDIWMQRLEDNEPWIHKWLAHQTRDKYWEHGSICEDYSKVKCAVFLIGGWADTYRTAIFRMAQHLTCDWRALIGPWPHLFPDECSPGPRIGYVQQCLRFWDYHLKGIKNGLDQEPRFQLYLQESHPATSEIDNWPGRWIAEHQWPSPNVLDEALLMTIDGMLLESSPQQGSPSSTAESLIIGSPFSCGFSGGDIIPFNNAPGSLPGDQGQEDDVCLCWHGNTLQEPLDIVGLATLELMVSSDKPVATICARLVDVFPDGKATLITRGILNLTHNRGHTRELVEDLKPDQTYNVKITFDSIGYTILNGHKLRLAVSQSYWPCLIWPPPSTPTLRLHFSSPPCLKLPIRNRGESARSQDRAVSDLGEPVFSTPLPIERLRLPSNQRYFTNDLVNSKYRGVFNADFGKTLRKDTNLTFGRQINHVYEIKENEPLSSTVAIETEQVVERLVSGDNVDTFSTKVKTNSRMRADREHFYIDSEVKAWNGDELAFEKTWKHSIKRDHV